MLQSLAKLSARLNMDGVGNAVLERVYSAFGNGRGGRFQILTYHKVSDDPHPYFEPVTPAIFEQQAARAVAITFDDGYRDNYEQAFPILKKYDLPATIFVATGSIETGNTLWHDRVFDAFRYTTEEAADLSPIGLGPVSLAGRDERNRALQQVLRRAKELYGDERQRFVESIEQALTPGRTAPEADRMLSWAQIREMNHAGIRIGSHTVTHPILSKVPNDQLKRELLDSRDELQERLGSEVTTFAYPNGKAADFSDAVKAAVKECGYRCAVTTQPGPNRPYEDPFQLRRGQPWQADIDVFRLSFFLQRHELEHVWN
jgi:peptidoglycan/xylan/chitin deacetylase (PgdA/CDA1 family)